MIIICNICLVKGYTQQFKIEFMCFDEYKYADCFCIAFWKAHHFDDFNWDSCIYNVMIMLMIDNDICFNNMKQ